MSKIRQRCVDRDAFATHASGREHDPRNECEGNSFEITPRCRITDDPEIMIGGLEDMEEEEVAADRLAEAGGVEWS